MQSTTVENAALEAALLCPEQLQFVSKAARILGKGMEEVTRDMTNSLKQLQDLWPTALEAAAREAVQQWMDCTAGAEAVAAYGQSTTGQTATAPPATCSGRSELDKKMGLLAKW